MPIEVQIPGYEKTGASSATISRVNRSLNYGTDAYHTIFDRLDKEEKA